MMFPLQDCLCLLLCFKVTVTFVIMHSFSMCWHCTDIFLAYRSIFCNDIYLLEVCTDEAVQLQKEVCWEPSVAEELLRLCCGIVWNPVSILRKSHYFFQLSIDFVFSWLNIPNCSWSFVFCFSIPSSFIKMPAINSTYCVLFHMS